jgi:hypothetical protein
MVASEGGADWTSNCIRQLWSLEAILSSITSAAGQCHPTSKTWAKPIHMPVKDSSDVSTSGSMVEREEDSIALQIFQQGPSYKC